MLRKLASVLVARTTPAPRAAQSLGLRGGHMSNILIDTGNHYRERITLWDDGPKGVVSLAPCHQGEYLASSEREWLRRTIQRTVVPMAAENLAARYEMGLEHDRRYDTALANFCAQVIKPATRASALRELMRREIPADQPEIVSVLFIEAAARLLGRKWVDDDCNFVDVTIGTTRIQEIIRLLSFEFRNKPSHRWTPFVVITTPLGEQHTLAQHILGLLLDSMGWSSQILDGKDAQGSGLRSALKRADIICIGWGNQRLKKEFKDLITTARAVTPGLRTPIVVGGVAALDSVDFLVSLGIDCVCDSVYSASRILAKFHELEAVGQQAHASDRRFVGSAGRPDWLIR